MLLELLGLRTPYAHKLDRVAQSSYTMNQIFPVFFLIRLSCGARITDKSRNVCEMDMFLELQPFDWSNRLALRYATF